MKQLLSVSTIIQIFGLALIGAGVGLLAGLPAALTVVGVLLFVPAALSDFAVPKGSP